MKFWKYQGAGNDFVMLDQRERQWLTRADQPRIEQLCDRRFGIGADGLILLQQRPGFDFEMVYFNADGRESSMCGNGGRCIAAFAQHLGAANSTCRFWAIDGAHEAVVRDTEPGREAWVELKMSAVDSVEQDGAAFVLNTGSPHYVRFVEGLADKDMLQEGRAVRYGPRFAAAGINVNLVEEMPDMPHIRTYERGVEGETLACGTGVTAAAIATFLRRGAPLGRFSTKMRTRGAVLELRFEAMPGGKFDDIWLCGPARMVFQGEI